jgi:hypothetical protein
LTTGLNGLEVNYKLGREVMAKMTVDDFAAPMLNPNAANVTQVKGGGGVMVMNLLDQVLLMVNLLDHLLR